jgi:hypothetical protein
MSITGKNPRKPFLGSYVAGDLVDICKGGCSTIYTMAAKLIYGRF